MASSQKTNLLKSLEKSLQWQDAQTTTENAQRNGYRN